MNTLVIFPKEELRETVAFFLQGQFGMEVRSVATIEEVKKSLSSTNEAYDLVICDYAFVGSAVLEYATTHKIDIHILYGAEGMPKDPLMIQRKQWNHPVPNKDLLQHLGNMIKHLFREFQAPPSTVIQFCTIQPKLLFHANPLPGPVYVKLTEEKYVRVLLPNAEFDTSDYEYFFTKRKFTALSVKKEHCLLFASKIYQNLRASLLAPIAPIAPSIVSADPAEENKKKLEALKNKAKLLQEALSEVVEIKGAAAGPSTPAIPPAPSAANQEAIKRKAQQILELQKARQLEKTLGDELEKILSVSKGMGFSPEVQELTKKSVMGTIQMVRTAPGLSDLLRQMTKEKDKYISSHSMLLAYMSCAIASQLEWRSEPTYQKLTLASFLHDSTLENQALARVQTLAELAAVKEQFTPQELKDFRLHPITASQIATKFSEIPPDVDSIIAQHHELPNGEGFPRGLSHSRMGPLAAVFIVAHDLVSRLLKDPRNMSDATATQRTIEQFAHDTEVKYHVGNFRKILAAVARIKS